MATLSQINNFSFLKQHSVGRMEIICELLNVYNCRISEILQAKWKDYYPNKYLVLRAVKHSRDIIVRDRIILLAISKLHHIHPDLIFYPVNYFRVYYHIKSNYSHLFSDVKIKKNKKITHYFRYNNVKNINEVSIAQSILNHNSKKSCVYYNQSLKKEF